jgi:hypothetical protein
MKWLTRGWAEGEFSDTEAEQMLRAYREHVEQIAPALEPFVAKLALETNLHDAIIEVVHVYDQGRRLVLSLVAGDQQAGYQGITLDYRGVEMDHHYMDVLRRRSRERETAILYDEVDAEPDGTFVHRLLFWPEGEIAIAFKHLTLSSAAREDRRTFLSGSFLEHD